MHNTAHANFPRASFERRLGAIIYDLLLAIAVYIVFGAIGIGIFAFFISIGLIPLDQNQSISELLNGDEVYLRLFQLYLFCCLILFYAIFWSKGGQTLGMRAWRVKVQHINGQNLSFPTAILRVLYSLFGLGNILMLLRSDQQALQDILAKSEVVVLSKEANKMRNWHGV